mmetsp:Transcript_30769/g.31282  ORF Transcript_30769/g.31282 Transcript_30769/m.31282 type:complete len:106 (+) Transcript_30769:281-598(+)
MKLSIAALSFTTTATSVPDSMLRGRNKQQVVNNHNNNVFVGTIFGTESILRGTDGEPTAKDKDVLGKDGVASSDNVHWEVGHSFVLGLFKNMEHFPIIGGLEPLS